MSSRRELAVYEAAPAIQPAGGANAGAVLVARAEEHETKLASTLGAIKSQVGELMLSMRNGALPLDVATPLSRCIQQKGHKSMSTSVHELGREPGLEAGHRQERRLLSV